MHVSSTRRERTDPGRRRAWLLGPVVALALLALPGCATRSVYHNIVTRHSIEVELMRQVRGFSTQKLGHDHPAIISSARLVNILGALEVEVRDERGAVRQPAIHRDILEETAEVLSEALAQAGPDEEVAIKAIRKEARIGILHRKFLTTFLAHVDDDQLYISLRRVEWQIPRAEEKKRLPNPSRDRKVMDFRVVTAEPIYFAGVQDVEIDWRNDVFRNAFRMPGSTGGEKRRREVLESIPVPKEELRTEGGSGTSIEDLSPEQLRALADLEEERRAGRMTENDYQRARRQLLRSR